MEVGKASFLILVVFSRIFAMGHANSLALAPAPSHSTHGMNIDQGIAYTLILVALLLTYLIH